MNKTLSMTVAGLALISAVVTATLWHELRDARQRATSPELQDNTVAVSNSPAVPLPTSLPQLNDAATPATEAAPTPSIAPVPVTIPPMRMVEKELQNDPEYRKARLASLRASLMRNFPGLAEALHLTPEETDKFFNVMAETQLALTEIAVSRAEGQRAAPNDEADWNTDSELWRNREAVRRRQADAFRELLGPARYEQWLNYQPTRNSRMQASTFATALTEAGTPLDPGQIQSLESAVAAEQTSLKRDIVALGRTVDTSNPVSQAQAQEALRRRQTESNRRILDAVTPYLTATQLGSLRTYVDQEETVTRAMAAAQQRARELQAKP